MSDFRLIIVTGLSGAGKSQTLNCLEDLDFFCVDNLPPTLIPKFLEVCTQPGSTINKMALGIDVRERGFFGEFFTTLKSLEDSGIRSEILFLDASNDVLLQRFSETRRKHPLGPDEPIKNCIEEERKLLAEIRSRATHVVDTSGTNVHELREIIWELVSDSRAEKRLQVTIYSFGYKYGIPEESDLVFDVRFLPNPNYVPTLKPYTGYDEKVEEYVLNHGATQTFMARLFEFMSFLIPCYLAEGKAYLTVSLGCTGGRHRSVVLANQLKKSLESQHFRVRVRHRDIGRCATR